MILWVRDICDVFSIKDKSMINYEFTICKTIHELNNMLEGQNINDMIKVAVLTLWNIILKMFFSKHELGTLLMWVRDIWIFTVKISKVQKNLFTYYLFLGFKYDHVYKANKNQKLCRYSLSDFFNWMSQKHP